MIFTGSETLTEMLVGLLILSAVAVALSFTKEVVK